MVTTKKVLSLVLFIYLLGCSSKKNKQDKLQNFIEKFRTDFPGNKLAHLSEEQVNKALSDSLVFYINNNILSETTLKFVSSKTINGHNCLHFEHWSFNKPNETDINFDLFFFDDSIKVTRGNLYKLDSCYDAIDVGLVFNTFTDSPIFSPSKKITSMKNSQVNLGAILVKARSIKKVNN